MMNAPPKRPSPEKLSTHALNRALLARQMLLDRAALSPLAAVERLAGMQAQVPQAPYVGLWSRLQGFRPEALSALIEDCRVVRIASLRATIHLLSAADCRTFRPLAQPVFDRVGFSSAEARSLRGIARDEFIAAAREAVNQKPLTWAELRRHLATRWPEHDDLALLRAVQFALPLVQVPPRGLWRRSGAARVTTAEAWLGRPLTRRPSLAKLVLRYLAAFGPASVLDIQAWSGLTRLAAIVEKQRPKLHTFTGEDGRELFDIPDAPRPDEGVAAPVRFLPEFDNLTLAHANRSRIVNRRPKKPLPDNAVVKGFLVDGFVAGYWKIVRDRDRATLQLEPFEPLSRSAADALVQEGERLLTFAAPELGDRDVRIITAD
jgi:hypothetical protein